MPVKPPPLALLRSSLLFTSRSSNVSLNPTHQRSGSTRFLAGIFPFRLRHLGLELTPLQPVIAVRGFSARPRSESGSNRAPKSLAEDEAELSDWVSELRTGSYRAGVFTDNEDEPERRMKKRDRDASSGSSGVRESGGLGRDNRIGAKVGFRGINLDEGRGRGRGGNVRRGSDDLGVKNPRVSRRFDNESDDSEDDDDDEEDGWKKKTGADRGGARGGGRGGRIEGRGGERGGRFEGRGGGRGGRIEGRGGGRGGRIEGRGGGRGGIIGGRGGERSRGRPALLESDDEGGGKFSSREKNSASSFVDLIGDEDSEEASDSDSDDEIEMDSRSSLFPNEEKRASTKPSSSSASGSYLSETRFDQCAISPLSLKAIKDVGYEKMTVVQEATLPVILRGKDVMAKARTGTGKTVAFLLPSIEVVVKSPPADRDQKRQPILVLVICPTRELASQAAAEANTLLKYHSSIGVQVVMGGTRLAVEQKRMQANPCQFLVATPGRLRDHIENTAGFATRLMGVKVLVLDEADHLLDMGFRKDIEKIISAVPNQRQTLLFSATIPDEVRQVSNIALKRDHEYINTVQAGSEATHSQVRQMHLVAPLEKHFPLLYTILKEHISEDVNFKVLVFCTTAMVTKLVADMLGELSMNVREIHSRKPQSYRTRVSDEFRKSTGLILVTSDVSARGVDYPDVTLVMQLGLPADREQYIHRLGRTGRKGKEGKGILLLAPWEESFLSSIKDLPITKATAPTVDSDVKRKVEKALSHVEMKSKESAYQAWLGYYNSNKIVGRDKSRLVELANEFSRCMGLDNPPAISKLVLGKMGLKNVPGLRSK